MDARDLYDFLRELHNNSTACGGNGPGLHEIDVNIRTENGEPLDMIPFGLTKICKNIMNYPRRKYEDKYYSFISSIFGNNLSEEKRIDLDNIINKIYQDGYEDGVNSVIED